MANYFAGKELLLKVFLYYEKYIIDFDKLRHHPRGLRGPVNFAPEAQKTTKGCYLNFV